MIKVDYEDIIKGSIIISIIFTIVASFIHNPDLLISSLVIGFVAIFCKGIGNIDYD